MYRLATIDVATYVHEGHHYRVFADDIVDLPEGLPAGFMAHFELVDVDGNRVDADGNPISPAEGDADTGEDEDGSGDDGTGEDTKSMTGAEIDAVLAGAANDELRRVIATQLLEAEHASEKPRSTVIAKLSKLVG